MAKNIKLPEHNSSRLLFISNYNYDLDLEETGQSSGEDELCSDSDECNGCKFLLGKLNNNIYLLEDCGVYDSNHTHTASISYTNELDNKTILYNVTRIMEYGQECDRLYTEHSGSLKFILLDSPSGEQSVNLYIKHERSKPSIFENIGSIQLNNGTTYNGCALFYKYDENTKKPVLSEVVQIVGNLIVTNDLNQPVNNINYAGITINRAIIDFSKMSIYYTITANNSNDVKINFIGTKSPIIDTSKNYYGKFISKKYYQDNDNFIEPGYFVIQAPKNRSWICYRTCYGKTLPGTYAQHKKNNYLCYFINEYGTSLNGYYGTSNGNNYEYEINIDRSQSPFLFMLPEIFWNYQSIEYYNNDNSVSYDGGSSYPISTIYNELDGIYYKLFTITNNSQIYKIKLIYSKV